MDITKIAKRVMARRDFIAINNIVVPGKGNSSFSLYIDTTSWNITVEENRKVLNGDFGKILESESSVVGNLQTTSAANVVYNIKKFVKKCLYNDGDIPFYKYYKDVWYAENHHGRPLDVTIDMVFR